MDHDNIPKSLMQALLLPLIDELLPFVNTEDAAWEAAEAATMCFNPQNPNEFRLAVRVALFNIMANRLTVEANASTLTPACAIRMRNCALSYAREADKAERHLEKRQADRPQEEKPHSEAETAQTEPATDPTPVEAERTTSEPQEAPAAAIPAYKLLKQERRMVKQQERDARLKAQAETHGERNPDLPLAA